MVRGKRLRLEQQYFFVSCALQDMIRIYGQREKDLSAFHEKYAVQLNDTHPAVAVAELMRLLVDVHGMGWDEAWEITRRTFAYTNHAPPEASKWKVEMFGSVSAPSRDRLRSTAAFSTGSEPLPGRRRPRLASA
jgi:starch phosphorylase